MIMNENRVKHLEMIEDVIERMGNNSFQLKGWAVTLVTIIGTLAAQGSDKRFFALAFVPLVAFWLLDTYYLQLERKYKILYRNAKDCKVTEFDMDTRNIVCTEDDKKDLYFLKCMFARAEGWFYFSILAVLIVLAVVLKVFTAE